MSAWKYVMFRDKKGRHFPVIFPAEMVHDDTADAIQHAVRSGELGAGLRDWSCPKPVSAGFIGHLAADYVGGESETLSMASRPVDKEIINSFAVVRGLGWEEQG